MCGAQHHSREKIASAFIYSVPVMDMFLRHSCIICSVSVGMKGKSLIPLLHD